MACGMTQSFSNFIDEKWTVQEGNNFPVLVISIVISYLISVPLKLTYRSLDKLLNKLSYDVTVKLHHCNYITMKIPNIL